VHPLTALLVGFVVMQASTLATSVYLHRGLTHKALTVHPVAAIPFRVILWVTTGMRPREWAAVHRRHHAALDTAGDPHSPAVLGFWRVQLTNAYLYQRAVRDRPQVERYSRDLPPDRLDRWFFDHDLLGPALGIAFLCLVFGWETGLLAAAIHSVLYVGLNGAVNSIGHTRGLRPRPNSGTNGRLLALLTMGEGLHNNHHAAPTSARFSIRDSELDPGWWLVSLMRSFGWANVRHDQVHLAA
jgi:stearoyl-CoA desaturase (delta-9 desaturase)